MQNKKFHFAIEKALRVVYNAVVVKTNTVSGGMKK